MSVEKHQHLCHTKVLAKQLYEIFLESYINQEKNQIQKGKY